jgi:hypothetical protein
MPTISIVDRVRPDRSTDALVKAACLGDVQRARVHWDYWCQHNRLDDVDWRDQRYLARLVARLPAMVPGCPINPRLLGLARAMWTRSRMAVGAAARLIDAMSAAGAPVLLLGSAAVEARAAMCRNHGAGGAADLQILTTRAWFDRAQVLAQSLGFHRKPSRMDAFGGHASIALGGAGPVFLALWSQPVHLPHLGNRQLRDFWSRAEPTTFRGRRVLIASHEDMIALAARQSFERTKGGRPATVWPLDMVDLLSGTLPCSEAVIAAAGQICGLTSLAGAIGYLSDHLDIDGAQKMIEITRIGYIVESRWRLHHEFLRILGRQLSFAEYRAKALISIVRCSANQPTIKLEGDRVGH